MELNEKLSQLRKKKGLTQLELAEALNVSRQAISRWEVGTAVPTLDNLVNLSEVYGVPLDDLIQSKAPTSAEEALPDIPPPPPSKTGRLHIPPVPPVSGDPNLGRGNFDWDQPPQKGADIRNQPK